jgi:hypothetical protein
MVTMLELLIAALLVGHVAIVVVGHFLLLRGTLSDENEGRDPAPPPVHLGLT